MLRTAKTNLLNSRVIALNYETSRAAVTIGRGYMDVVATNNGAGDVTLTPNDAFSRVPVVVATPGVAGGYTQIHTATATAARIVTVDTDGSATDGTCHAVIYGWDHEAYVVSACPQKVHSSQLRPRVIPVVLSDPDTITEGQYEVTATAASNVTTLTFNRPFQCAPVVIANPDTLGNSVVVSSPAVNSVVLTQVDARGVATTNGMHVLIFGFDIPDPIGMRHAAMKVTQHLPRIVAGRITVTGGTPSVSGYPDVSVVDGGVGSYVLVGSPSWLRAPVCVASMSTAGSCAIAANNAVGCRIDCATVAGVAVDPTTVHFIMCGFDDAVQV